MVFMKKALITGVTGQDGSYLSELLLEKGYEVHGVIRRTSSFNTSRIMHLYKDVHEKDVKFFLHYGDLADASSLNQLIKKLKPDEIYNLGAQSHVRVSFDVPEYTADITGLGTLRILDAIRESGVKSKFYQASSSEMFGNTTEFPQKETTPMTPCSPYAFSKLFGYWATINYRNSYNIFACNGILFNHESPRRGETFVSRKITRAVTRIKAGLQKKLYLGNLDAKRDWGYAPEFCINKDVPILTTKGWMFCDDIQEGQEIINFDYKRNRLSRDKVIKKIIMESNGDKIILKGRGVYLKTTPEHKIFYQSKSKKSKGGWSQWKSVTAKGFYDNLKEKSNRTKYDYRLPHFQDYDADDYKGVSDEQLYVMGALLAEGCIHKSQRQNDGVQISISQSYIANEQVFKKIQHAIDTLKLEYKIRERNDGCVEWNFSSESSKKILEWFDVPNVHIMPRYFYMLSKRQCETVFDALMDCDGSWSSMVFCSKRYLLATDFQTIAHLGGYRTTEVKKRSSDDCYNVNVIVRRKKHTYAQEVEKTNDNSQEVWCVQTKNGTIITRDNGCISISGNCEAMWLMMQQENPEDIVIATGETHTVKEFVEEAFNYAGLNWKDYVEIDQRYFRPTELEELQGDFSKARKILGWNPRTKFKDLVKIMIDADMAIAKNEKYLNDKKNENK